MKHLTLNTLIACACATAFTTSVIADTVDERIKRLNPETVRTGETTRDQCRDGKRVIIVSTTDGAIELKPGETKYFRIKKTDDWTRSGGWTFTCGGALEFARMKGAEYIKAVRSEETGQIDWFRVTVDI